jgi:DnaK suppressor protein
MELSAQAKVRAQLASMKSALEGGPDTEVVASREKLRGMQNQQSRRTGDAAQYDAQMRKIEAAIARLDQGKYGYCVTCNAEIEGRRLQQDPATVHCAKCGGDQQ